MKGAAVEHHPSVNRFRSLAEMNVNVGRIDRALRIIGGLLLISLAVAGIGTPWTWIGIVPFATGMVGRCLAYSLFGVNSCSPGRHARVQRK